MEARFSKLEGRVSELGTEMKLMNSTLNVISETLSEFKIITKEIGIMKTDQALMLQTINEAKERGIRHTARFERFERRLNSIDKEDGKQQIKISSNERFIWLFITVVVGFAVYKLKG